MAAFVRDGGSGTGEDGGATELRAPPRLEAYRAQLGGADIVLLEWPTGGGEPARALGEQERAVLELALAGLSSARIAALRGRSRRTVENQLASIFAKLGVRGRLELFALPVAREHRDVDVEAVRRTERLGPAEAASAWRGIAEGRWTILALWEGSGQRRLLLQPGTRAALSPRERTAVALAARGGSNKAIAYRLGLAPSTAAEALATAARKLGLCGRRELIATFGAAAARADGPDRTASPDSP